MDEKNKILWAYEKEVAREEIAEQLLPDRFEVALYNRQNTSFIPDLIIYTLSSSEVTKEQLLRFYELLYNFRKAPILVLIPDDMDYKEADIFVAAGCAGYTRKITPEKLAPLILEYINGATMELSDKRRASLLAQINGYIWEAFSENTLKSSTEVQKAAPFASMDQEQMLHSGKLAIMGELVAGFAHEIKNPISAINAYMSAIKKQLKTTKNYRLKAAIEGLDSALRHLNSTVLNFVDFSRKTKEQFSYVDVPEIIQRAVALSKPHLTDHDVDIDLDIGKDLSQIVGMSNQLVQVFLNLIINAVQAMRDVRGWIGIKARQVDSGRYIEIKVSDNGKGIPPENLEKIFDAFYTTKDISAGTGLGLSVSYGIIQKHKGFISVESEVGQGTVFTIKLPTISNPQSRNI